MGQLAEFYAKLRIDSTQVAKDTEAGVSKAGPAATKAGKEAGANIGAGVKEEAGKGAEAAGKESGHRFGESFKEVAGPLLAALTLAGGIELFKGFLDSAREAAKVSRQTEAVIKSTGGSAHVTAKGIEEMAAHIQKLTGIDHDTIAAGQNMLLTFTNIRNETGKGNDIFTQATSILTDMSSAMTGGNVSAESLRKQAIQLGKALNDPVKGMSALARVGVTFTDQQKKQVTAMVASGHTLAAQKLILHELNKEFGGTAAAAADPMKKLSATMHDVSETIGGFLLPALAKGAGGLLKLVDEAPNLEKVLAPVFDRVVAVVRTSVIPAFHEVAGVFAPVIALVARLAIGAGILAGAFGLKLLGALKPVADFLVRNKTLVQSLAVAILTIVGAMKLWALGTLAVESATKVMAAAQTALNLVLDANPIGVVVLALAGLAAGFVYAYKHSQTFRNVVQEVFGWIRTHWPLLLAILAGPIGLAVLEIIKHWHAIQGAAAAVFNWIRGHWPLLLAILTGPIGLVTLFVAKHFDQIRAVISDAMRNVAVFFLKMLDNMLGGIRILTGVMGHLPGPMGAPFRAASKEIDNTRTHLRNLVNDLSDVHSKQVHIKINASGDFLVTGGKGVSIHSARGAYINQGQPGVDDQLVMAQRGELVVPTKMVAAGWVDHLRGMIPGFKAGGIIGHYSDGATGAGHWLTRDVDGFTSMVESAVAKAGGAAIRSAQAKSGFGGISGGGGGGPNVAIGQRMAASIGWTGNNWLFLRSGWMEESGWRTNAQNPAGGPYNAAYGIPQSNPGSKMAAAGPDWLTNPVTQIRWGLGYIRSTYGSPTRVPLWSANGPLSGYQGYADGGVVGGDARHKKPVDPRVRRWLTELARTVKTLEVDEKHAATFRKRHNREADIEELWMLQHPNALHTRPGDWWMHHRALSVIRQQLRNFNRQEGRKENILHRKITLLRRLTGFPVGKKYGGPGRPAPPGDGGAGGGAGGGGDGGGGTAGGGPAPTPAGPVPAWLLPYIAPGSAPTPAGVGIGPGSVTPATAGGGGWPWMQGGGQGGAGDPVALLQQLVASHRQLVAVSRRAPGVTGQVVTQGMTGVGRGRLRIGS